jgi:hypothetical protein
MTNWTDEEMRAQGYEVDPDHPANFEARDKLNRQIDANASRRESLLPCGQATGPLAEKETPVPLTEIERLFPDRERVARVLAARKAAGI